MEIKQRLGELELTYAREGITGKESVIQYTVEHGKEHRFWEYKPTKEWVKEWEETRKGKQFLYGVDLSSYDTGDEVEDVEFVLLVSEYEEVDGKLEFVGAGYWAQVPEFNDLIKGETLQDLYDEFVYQVEEVLKGGRTPVMDSFGNIAD